MKDGEEDSDGFVIVRVLVMEIGKFVNFSVTVTFTQA